jgi:hypothetical protein
MFFDFYKILCRYSSYWGYLVLCCLLPMTALCSEGIAPKRYRIVVCAVFQNEAFFLHEWLEYHRLLGVEHFYLYNNLSDDAYAEILEPYCAAGLVDLFEWPVETHNQQEYLDQLQLPVYNDAMQLASTTAEWAAFIDLDEFIVPKGDQDLYTLLQSYSTYGGLSINWQLFGTAGLEELPTKALITESLLWKAPIEEPINRIVKLIVQPDRVQEVRDPHYFEFKDGYYAVDTNGNRLEKQQVGQPVVIDKVQLNHYWCGVRQWFIHNKVPRRAKWGIVMLPEEIEEIVARFNVVVDDAILRFTPELKMCMDK